MLDAGLFLLVVYILSAVAAGVIFLIAWLNRGKIAGRSSRYLGLVDTNGIGKLDIICVAVLLSLYCLFVLAEAFAPQREIDGLKITPLVIVGILISQLIPLGIVGFFVFLKKETFVDYFRLKQLKLWHLLCTPVVIFFVYLLFIAMMLSGYQDLMKFFFGDEVGEQVMVKAYREIERWEIRAGLAVCICIVAPLVEELVFRGVIYRTMKRYSGVIIATLVSSVVFSIVHMNVASLLPLFILAVILVVTYELTESIWIPIAIHALFNFTSLLMMEVQRVIGV